MGGLPDLHRHLDGSLRPETLAELAAARGVTVPADLRFRAGMGLTAALERFAVTLSVLQDAAAVERVAGEICDDAAADGVTTFELRFAPQLHQGGTLREIAEACARGVRGRAGIVLCALYGDPPALAQSLVDVAVAVPAVVGLDLAGGPSPGGFRMADYAGAFERARDLGLGRTVHAGEGRPPAEIATAITRLHAQRIGHATTLLDDPAVVALVRERGVTIEACPTSNRHTGAVPEGTSHPLPRWLAAGVRACINTDNTLLSDVSASEEHRRAGALPGMTPVLVALAMAHGHAAAFPRRT